MKVVTKSKQLSNGDTLTVTYGKLGGTEPYFAITGQFTNARGQVCGTALQSEISMHFPELDDLLPWDLTYPSGEPIAFFMSLYHHRQKEFDDFRRTAIYGALASDYIFIPEAATSQEAETWLRVRLPLLQAAFHRLRERFGLND